MRTEPPMPPACAASERGDAALTAVNRVLELALSDQSEQEMCEACLDLLETVTGSRISFIGEIGNEGLLHDLAISNAGGTACKMRDSSGHGKPPTGFRIHGIYGRVLTDARSLIVNDPASHPDRIGLPEGHPPLTAFLGVPLWRQGKVVGMVAVGNRENGYRIEEQQTLEAVAPAIVGALDRKRAEVALRASEGRERARAQELQTVLDAVPAAVWIAHDPEALRITGNRLSYEWVRLPEGANPSQSLPESERARTFRMYKDGIEVPPLHMPVQMSAAGAEVRDYEFDFLYPDGSVRHVLGNASPLRDERGQSRGSVSAFVDITARKQAEAAVRESEEQFRVLAQNLVSAVALVNERGEFGIVNRSFLRMFDLDEQADILNVNSQDWSQWRVFDENGRLLDVDEHPVRKAALTRTAVKDKLVAVQSPAHTDLKWLLVSADPILDGHGNLHRLICTYHDITARKQAEEALQEANVALAEADRRKDEFIAILSHELRNPLAPIRYGLAVLGAQTLDEAGGRALTVVGRQVDHLVRLVDDLLDVSRITRGKIELRREHVTLASVVTAAAEAASPAITAGRHTLRMDVPDDPVWLYADPARIAQVVNNLLDNSAKYTPKGGEILLQAERDAGGVVIRVRDNGMGIPADALPAVFEMFRQVGRPGRSQGGLGIGLALVKLLVELHGGTIEARSAGVGQGAEFVVRLPVAEDMTLQPERGTPVPAGGRRLRVLVVDDNADLVEMLAVAVESAGHEVRKALDGPSGVSAALSYRPDVVLLDVGLPGMSGIEVARELRRQPDMTGVRLVALTGWGQAEDRRQTRDAGFDYHLTKPTEPDALQRLLAEIASEAASAPPARR